MKSTTCILWPGAVSLGYPKYGPRLAHRLVWEAEHGPLPQGWVVHHKCRVKLCVNPAHLEAMTRQAHLDLHKPDRREGRHNAAKTHCPAGHAYDTDNTYLYRNMRMCKECRRAVNRQNSR